MNDGPLSGMAVLVTRPAARAEPLCAAIESAGGTAVRFPVVRIDPRDSRDIDADLSALPSPDIVVFVSRSAAEYGAPAFEHTRAAIAAVGSVTRDALESLGIRVAIDPGHGFTSEQLLAHDALRDVAGKNILVVRGQDGRALLGESLRDRGARVDYLPVYVRGAVEPPEEEIDRLLSRWASGGVDCVSVMSVATLEYLVAALPRAGMDRLRETPLVAPGERVIKTAGNLVPGIRTIQAPGPLPDNIVSALADWRRSGMNR